MINWELERTWDQSHLYISDYKINDYHSAYGLMISRSLLVTPSLVSNEPTTVEK